MGIEQFLDIEKKYHLFDLVIDGVQYWTYARFNVWNWYIFAAQLDLDKVHRKKKHSVVESIQLAMGLAYNSLFRKKIPKKNVDILFLNHERRIQNGDYYECAYTERLSDLYTNSITLEKPYMYHHYRPVKTNNLMYADFIIVKAYLSYTIQKTLKTRAYRRVYHMVEMQLSDAINEMRTVFPFKVDNSEIYSLFTEKIMLYKKEYKAYELLIDKVKPKVIVEVVYYCIQNMIINEIAKKRGITTIELQHGMMPKSHVAYQFPEGVSINQFADRLFLFADFWKQNIHVPVEQEQLLSVGYPLFEEKVQLYQKSVEKDGRKTILFVSQGTSGKHLSNLAVTIRRLLAKEEYRIIYKLHPGECQTWRECYPVLQDEGIEVIDKPESIYNFFAASDVQIGLCSTAVYEGIGFGLPALLLKVGDYESMSPLVDAGYARFIDCAEDILNYLKEDTKKTVVSDSLWKKNALQNLKYELDRELRLKKVHDN